MEAKTIRWGKSHEYDIGQTPIVDTNGQVTVEVHQGHDDRDLWYCVGSLDPETKTIRWGKSYKYNRGRIPTVALQGKVVIEVHRLHTGSNLWHPRGHSGYGYQDDCMGQQYKV